MRSDRRMIASLLLTAALVAGCGEGSSSAPAPTTPPVGVDKAMVRKALLTPADLGRPWVQPKKVNTAKRSDAKDEFCPGVKHTDAANPPRATTSADFTEGAKAGAAILGMNVRAHELGKEQAWRDAFAAVTKGCAAYPEDPYFAVGEVVATPPTIEGTDEVLTWIQRIYEDRTKKKLLYARHHFEARVGRYVVEMQHSFIQTKADPNAEDLTTSTALLTKQVAKLKATLDAST